MMSIFEVYLVLFKFMILSSLSQATCPPNSTPGTNNGKCYSFLNMVGDFNSAERACTEVGGHLVSICNAFENNILAEVAIGKLQAYGTKDFWIGYNDQFSRGVWNWTSSSNYQPGNFDCASFQISGGKWQGSDCTIPKAFVCETYSENQSVKPMCKSGYTYYDEWNTCYKYFTAALPWSDAEKSCVNDGGHLLSIHSKDEAIFIDVIMHQISAYNGAWMGLYSSYPRDPSISKYWAWIDGTPVTYTDWYPGYPHNITFNQITCAYIISSGSPDSVNGSMYWANNIDCSNNFPYICKQFPICGSY